MFWISSDVFSGFQSLSLHSLKFISGAETAALLMTSMVTVLLPLYVFLDTFVYRYLREKERKITELPDLNS